MMKKNNIAVSFFLMMTLCTGAFGADGIRPDDLAKGPVVGTAKNVNIMKKLTSKWQWHILLRNDDDVVSNEQALSVESLSDTALVLRLPGTDIRIKFALKVGEKYLALRLEHIEGISERNILNIKVSVAGLSTLRTVPLDYMTKTSDLNITQTMREDDASEDLHNDLLQKDDIQSAEIPFLWCRTEKDPKGGFVFYEADDDEEETFFRIWVEENLPHPPVDGAWTIARAKEWVEEWKERCGTYSELYILPHGPEDLRPLAQEVKKLGIKNVYLHCDIWRGSFWPMDTEIFHINRKFFPAGAADLKDYGDYLKGEGLGLITRVVSCSIGPEHPRYMKDKPHEGISTWLRGSLHEAIDAEATELILDIDPGQDTWSGYWDERSTMDLLTISVGNELIKAGDIEKIESTRWRLTGCKRGVFATETRAHPQNERFRWLKSSYGFVFVAAPHHALFRECLDDYVKFVNNNNLAVANYDGLEIHRVDPYGANILLEETYKRIDHPVRANTSGGIPRWAYFQYRLPSVQSFTGREKPLFFKHQLGLFKIGLHQQRWAASGPYDYTYAFVPEIVHGGPISIQANRGFHNLELNDFKEHGLIPLYAKELNAWQKIGRNLPEPIKARIRASQYRRNTPIGPEQWPCADEQFRLAHHADNVAVEPFQVLKREGIDRPFCNGQEFGLLSPRQYIQPGDSMALINPYHKQVPEFIIKNMFTFDYEKRKGQIKIEPESEAEAIFNDMLDSFQGASMVSIEDEGRRSFIGTVNYQIQPDVKDITNCGKTKFSKNGDGLSMTLTNNNSDALLQVAWDKDTLPKYNVLSSFDSAGGMELTVRGDGSGAILVIRVQACGMRDYVVHIDFTGTRRIEIPSPECCYSEGRWRWMPAYKRLRGGPVTEVRLGFAMVPANKTASVDIEGMRFLPEKESSLLNPVISIGSGSLKIEGKIQTGRNLWYKGGATIGIYDLNWNKVKDMPVQSDNFIMNTGENQVTIMSKSREKPWLECQFITADNKIEIKK
ncbi:MAG: hypothetical protein H8D56_22550 [Planctomycetes bacterium]|nr:hypothetical protein [Planctomycetota bacterium]